MLDSSKKHLTLHNSLAVKLLTKYEVHLLINFGDVCDKNIWTNELSDQQDPRVWKWEYVNIYVNLETFLLPINYKST